MLPLWKEVYWYLENVRSGRCYFTTVTVRPRIWCGFGQSHFRPSWFSFTSILLLLLIDLIGSSWMSCLCFLSIIIRSLISSLFTLSQSSAEYGFLHQYMNIYREFRSFIGPNIEPCSNNICSIQLNPTLAYCSHMYAIDCTYIFPWSCVHISKWVSLNWFVGQYA